MTDPSRRRPSPPPPPPASAGDMALARGVERHGRQIKVYRAVSLAAALSLLTAYHSIDSRPSLGGGFWSWPIGWILLLAVALLWSVALVRIVAAVQFDRADSFRSDTTESAAADTRDHGAAAGPGPGAEAPAPQRDPVVICCSGGGIKSAAFCLGALQRLAHSGEYARADTVVGVSGGGYMAAAFALIRARPALPTKDKQPRQPAPTTPWVVPPGWVASMRRMTNYLGSSARVRFDLVSSWLYGVGVNVVITLAMTVVVAWTVAELASVSNLVDSTRSGDWTVNSDDRSWLRILFIPAVLLTVSAILFLLFRYTANFALLGSPVAARRWRPDIERSPAEELKDWMSNLPNALVVIAILYAVILVALPLTATRIHTVSLSLSTSLWNHAEVQVSAALAAVLTYAGVIRSAFKGLRPGQREASFAAGVLESFRRSLAPILALILFLGGLYLGAALLTARRLSEPAGLHDVGEILPWLLLLAVGRVAGTANQTSMFPFYRDRLRAAYLSDTMDGRDATDPTLGELEAVAGEPRLILCGTANVRDADLLPTGRDGTPFILGDQVGLTDTTLPGEGCLPTAAEYQRGDKKGDRDQITLATAVAISGAALSPVDGRDSRTFGRYRVLLALANVRLGVWLRNPYWATSLSQDRNVSRPMAWLNDWLDRTSPYHVIQEAVGTPSIYMPFLYVTDGGHYDNLGLVEALRRRPGRVIMLDGSGDAEDAFPTMGKAISTARMDLGVEIDFDPAPMIRGERAHPRRASVMATASYPDDHRCRIDYIKCVLPAGLSWDLESYQRQHPGFPATSQQFELYDEFDFEAYRQLGWCVVAEAERDWP